MRCKSQFTSHARRTKLSAMPSEAPPNSAVLPRRLKFLYGLGLSAEGVKTNAFNMFLLFYYQQVAGLGPVYTGVALFLALCIDAVIDPIVGVWSDGVSTRFGRRHPFMYASIAPLALSFYAVFRPPLGAPTPALFGWLLFFACGTRISMTLFAIPHQSLVPELTQSYDERTKLQSGRTVFAWLFGLLNALLAYTVFLKATPTSPYDPKGFPAFAAFGAAIIVLTTVTSALGTERAAIAAQPEAGAVKVVRIRDLVREIRRALESPNYRAAVFGGLFGAVNYGVVENMGNYMNLFFWGFKAQELAVFIAVIATASLTVLAAAPALANRFGKGRVAVATAAVTAVLTPLLVVLKLAGMLPQSGSPALLRVLTVAVFIGYSSLILAFVMIGAMIADVTDEHDLRTGVRQEGLLYSALTLITKAASGLGPLVAGIVLHLTGFPENARPGTVAPDTVRHLGMFVAAVTFVLGIVTAVLYRRYRITRLDHDSIVRKLESRRTVPTG